MSFSLIVLRIPRRIHHTDVGTRREECVVLPVTRLSSVAVARSRIWTTGREGQFERRESARLVTKEDLAAAESHHARCGRERRQAGCGRLEPKQIPHGDRRSGVSCIRGLKTTRSTGKTVSRTWIV